MGSWMGRRFVALAMGATLVMATVAPGTASPDGPRLRLRQAEFVPAAGETPDLPARLRIDDFPEGRSGTWIVQFDGPITVEDRTALEAAGARILSYLPDFAYKVAMTPAVGRRVATVSGVVWVGPYQPAFRIDPAADPDASGLFEVHLEPGVAPAAVRSVLRAAGIDVVSASGRAAVVSASAGHLSTLAGLVEVAWIEPFRIPERHNEAGGGVIMGAATAHAAGYDGSTQIVAVADTGLGDGTAASAHRDLASTRITAIYDWPTASVRGCYRAFPDGPQDVDSGHGTHTALSVVSAGGPDGEGMGTAPAASLVFQAVEDYIETRGVCATSPDGYYLTGLPDDLTDLFQQAYDAGARVHSNSWGSSVAGDYTADSATVDQFMWDHPDMLITSSAGNAGVDADADGVVDPDSIGSPATAKNLLTVGATENARSDDYPCDATLTYTSSTGTSCSTQGGLNAIFTYGDAWPDDFPTAPLASDPAAGDAEQMAAFSSRGPTDDGRIKPDLVAPGTWVLSGYSDLYQEGYDAATNPQNGLFQYDGWGFPFDSYYKYMGGTSMSNPLAAGAAVVVRDYYAKAHAHEASAALVKATLINSATDLADENNDGADDNDFPIPNEHEGWGRVDVAAAVDGTRSFVDEAVGSSTGDTDSYSYSVDGTSPFKVTLVWSDYPSDEAAAVNLVNDLDLVVTAPDGTTYLGNVFSGGWTVPGGSADRINNVESVYVASPAAGDWTVEVSAFNVPFGPQPYALVVTAAGDATPPPPVDEPPTVTITSPAGGTVSGTVTVTADASDDDAVVQVEFSVDGSVIGTDGDGSDGWSASWETNTVGDGDHTITAVATDTASQTGTDSVTVTVANDTGGGGATAIHVGDLDAVSVDNASRWHADVTVVVHDDTETGVEGATVSVDILAVRTFTGSCVTDSAGTCTISTRDVPDSRVDLMTITVTDVTHASLPYDPAANHDPDGDSDGTSVTVAQ